MQGMQEGDIDQYLDLAANSEGIVDRKYLAYEKSLAAGKANLQAGFIKLVKNTVGQIDFAGAYNDLGNMLGGFGNTLFDSAETGKAESRAALNESYQRYYTQKNIQEQTD